MTDREPIDPGFLNPDWVTSARTESGHYVVGFLFTDEASGVGAIKAVAELYNKTAGALGEAPPASRLANGETK